MPRRVEKVLDNAKKLTEALNNQNNASFKTAGLEQLSPDVPLGVPDDLASEASENLARQIDLTYGGMRGAPKFPQPLIYICSGKTGYVTGGMLAGKPS